jgi:hypothetical protein
MGFGPCRLVRQGKKIAGVTVNIQGENVIKSVPEV